MAMCISSNESSCTGLTPSLRSAPALALMSSMALLTSLGSSLGLNLGRHEHGLHRDLSFPQDSR